jgi:hypothetical protein
VAVPPRTVADGWKGNVDRATQVGQGLGTDMKDRIEVLQDVLVLGVGVEGTTVTVDVYGSAANACGVMRVSIVEEQAREEAVELLLRWGREDTPLSLIVQGTRVALQNDQAVFQAQLEPTSSP